MGYRGMVTKCGSADRYRCRCRTVITEGRPGNIERILQENPRWFEPQLQPSSARKRWIAHGLIAVGQLYLDQGAVTAICQAGEVSVSCWNYRCGGSSTDRRLCSCVTTAVRKYRNCQLQQRRAAADSGRQSGEIPAIFWVMPVPS